jgi:acetyl esterase/lipase
MHLDVAAAYWWLAQQDKVDLTRFGLVGASVGCSVALQYAARDRSVDVVVCLTPGVDYLGLNSIADIGRVEERSILLLASEDERKASDELGSVNPDATVQVLAQRPQQPHGLHGTKMFGQVPGIEEMIAEFLADELGPAASEPVVASIRGRVYYAKDSNAVKALKPENIRYFSSAQEAEARGLTESKSYSEPAEAQGGGSEP